VPSLIEVLGHGVDEDQTECRYETGASQGQ
jgi:hypothetical protein